MINLFIATSNGLDLVKAADLPPLDDPQQPLKIHRYQTNKDDPHSISSNSVRALVEDNKGRIWMGTNSGGVNLFNRQGGHFTTYRHQSTQANSLSNDNVLSIAEGPDNHIWIGTSGGLNKFDEQSNTFSHYTTKQGLSNNSVLGVLPDEQGNLWISTNIGLSRFNLATESFRNFDVNDGLQSNEFVQSSYFKGTDGELIFGGLNGFNRFYPEQIVEDERLPEIVLTRLLPPPWKTWWAYTLYLLLTISLIVAVVAWFVRNQRRQLRDQQKLNRQLRQVDKLKDEFLANTSHELRTPLHGIIGLSESLMDGVAGNLPNEANQNLAMVAASARGLSHLVNDILDFSKLRNANLTLTTGPVDLHSLIEVVLAMSRPLVGDKSLVLVNDIYKDLPSVEADENRLIQIFITWLAMR